MSRILIILVLIFLFGGGGLLLMTATEARGLGAFLVCSWSLSWCFGSSKASEA
jgi:hypothetical protein